MSDRRPVGRGLSGRHRLAVAALSSGLLITGFQAQPGGGNRVVDIDGRVIDIDAGVVSIDPRVVALDPRVEDLVAQSPAETTIEVSADILFAFNSAELSPQAGDQLGGVVQTIQDRLRTRPTGFTVQVAGHTDSVGTPAYNLDLSQRRADAVAFALRTALKTAPVAITAKGFGETQLLADDKDGQNTAAALRNRRVTITLPGGG